MSCRDDIDWRRIVATSLRALTLSFAIVITTSTARSETTPARSKAIAEELFAQGREAMRAGRLQEACTKLSESQRLDPAAGTLLNLAVCRELEGKFASAWAEYAELVVLAQRERQPDRERIATERMRALASKLAYVTLVLPKTERPPGLVVSLDGVSLGPAALGSPLPIDQGKHVVEVRAPGRVDYRTSFVISAEPGRHVLTIPVLAAEAEREGRTAEQSEPAPDPSVTLVRRLGIGAVAIGVVAAGLGSYFALSANDDWEERNQRCADGCDAKAVEASQRAARSAAYADAAFAFSLLTGGTGAFLLLVPLEVPQGKGKRNGTAFSSVVGVGGAF